MFPYSILKHKIMHSSQIISSLTQPRTLYFSQFQHLINSKDRISIHESRLKRSISGRIRVSDQKNMTELLNIDAFKRSDDRERDEISRNGSSCFDRILEFREFEANLNRMSKWLVLALFSLVIFWKHDAEAMWIAMGSVVNSLISSNLKILLNHQRPVSALRSDPGMPSAHAQSIFYIACFAVFSLLQWQGITTFTASIGSTILMFGSYLSWLRVSQNFHTISQVVVGAILGSTCSVTWFWMWHSFVLQAFIALIWVRIIVVLGSVVFCMAFLRYVHQHWFKDE